MWPPTAARRTPACNKAIDEPGQARHCGVPRGARPDGGMGGERRRPCGGEPLWWQHRLCMAWGLVGARGIAQRRQAAVRRGPGGFRASRGTAGIERTHTCTATVLAGYHRRVPVAGARHQALQSHDLPVGSRAVRWDSLVCAALGNQPLRRWPGALLSLGPCRGGVACTSCGASTARHGRAALWTALALGALFGWTQISRGAHFPSHVMWSLWVCWVSCVAGTVGAGRISPQQCHRSGIHRRPA